MAPSDGPRPGPSVLYEPPPVVPQLEVTAPFRADPLLVSGTDGYCDGEYLYQDYLFDDHGANTTATIANGGDFGVFPPAGDVDYPTHARYARNAADLVEFRVRPTKRAIVYRITLNAVLEPDATIVGIGVDRDRAGPTRAWPANGGVATPGLDAFVTAWGTGGAVWLGDPLASQPLPAGSVAIDTTRNQMTVKVPRELMDPGTATWRYVAGAGLRDGESFMTVPAGTAPTATTPSSGNNDRGAPGVFNLAFRFTEKQRTDGSNTAIGNGNWFEEGQAVALRDGTTGPYFADIDFRTIASACAPIHAPSRDQARVLGSRLDVPEGVHAGAAPNFGGRLQPYLLHLPEPSSQPPGIVLALHGNTATYTQWAAVSPNYIDQLGRSRNRVVISPLGRSTQGSGIEYDFFEAWADAVRHFELDNGRAVVSGYSAGGYMTFVLGLKYPDLFGGAFAIVGAARLLNGGIQGDHTNFNPMLGNARWVPYVSWNQVVDELAPYIGIRTAQDRMNEIGLRSVLYSFPVGEHFTPGLLDQWTGAADDLGEARVVRDPHRVDYTIAPENWTMLSPNYGHDERFPSGHIRADHAYWVSGLRTRDEVRDATNQIRGSISAISRAFGVGDAPPVQVLDVYPGPPTPATIDGTAWGPVPTTTARNALDLTLTNLRRAVVWGRRAKLSTTQPLEVSVISDGPAVVRLMLPYRRPPSVTASGSGRSDPTEGGLELRVAAGTTTFTLTP